MALNSHNFLIGVPERVGIKNRAKEDARMIEQAIANDVRDEHLNLLKQALKKDDEAKLLEVLEAIVKRILLEEKAQKMHVYK